MLINIVSVYENVQMKPIHNTTLLVAVDFFSSFVACFLFRCEKPGNVRNISIFFFLLLPEAQPEPEIILFTDTENGTKNEYVVFTCKNGGFYSLFSVSGRWYVAPWCTARNIIPLMIPGDSPLSYGIECWFFLQKWCDICTIQIRQ